LSPGPLPTISLLALRAVHRVVVARNRIGTLFDTVIDVGRAVVLDTVIDVGRAVVLDTVIDTVIDVGRAVVLDTVIDTVIDVVIDGCVVVRYAPVVTQPSAIRERGGRPHD
jgi:hypothetical protein